WAVEVALDAFHLRDAMDLSDVERAVLEGDAVRQVEAFRDRLHLARAAFVDHGVDVAGHAAGYEQRALVAPGHDPRVVDAASPELDLEALRYLDLADGDLARGLRRRWLGDRRERGALHVLRLSLLPRRRRRRLLGGDQAGHEENGSDEGERQREPQRAKPHDGSSGRTGGWSSLGWRQTVARSSALVKPRAPRHAGTEVGLTTHAHSTSI